TPIGFRRLKFAGQQLNTPVPLLRVAKHSSRQRQSRGGAQSAISWWLVQDQGVQDLADPDRPESTYAGTNGVSTLYREQAAGPSLQGCAHSHIACRAKRRA